MNLIIFWIAFTALFFALLNVLPDATTVTTDFATSLQLIVSNMKAWNTLFPIAELFLAVGTVVIAHLALWSWRGIKWLIHVVRGGGTS